MTVDETDFGHFDMDGEPEFFGYPIHGFFHIAGHPVDCFVYGPYYFFYDRGTSDRRDADFDFNLAWLTDSWRSGSPSRFGWFRGVTFGWMGRLFRRRRRRALSRARVFPFRSR